MAVQQFPGKMLRDSSVADAKLVELYIKANGTRDFTAAQSMGGFKLTSLASPTTGTDAANKNYVDALVNGLDVKYSCRVATTTAGTLASDFENGDTIDGVTLATGDRILIKDQSTASENGIYTVNASGAPTRATDADVDAEVTAGMFTFITEGTTWADTGWVLTTNDPIVVDTTALNFSQFSSASVITAGDGMTQTGNTFNVIAGDASLLVSADDIIVQRSTTGAIGLTGSGIEINTDGTSIEVDGLNDLRIASGAAGAGLDWNAGVLSVLYNTTSFDIPIDTLELNSSVAGDALDLNAGVLDVKVDTQSFAIVGDEIALDAAVAGDGLTLTAGVLDVAIDTNSFEFDGDNLALAAGIAGDGLVFESSGPGAIDVGAGAGIIVNANDVEVKAHTSAGINVDPLLGVEAKINLTSFTFNIGNGNIELNPTVAGDGLALNANILDVDYGDGLDIVGGELVIASALAGDALTLSAGVLDVNVDTASFAIVADAIALAAGVAGTGLTLSAGVLNAALPVGTDKDVQAAATTTDFDTTGVSITSTPADGSYVQVMVNGKQMSLGNGVKTKSCYFSADGGTTARAYSAIVATDTLYWVGSVAGFELATTDYIDLNYVA